MEIYNNFVLDGCRYHEDDRRFGFFSIFPMDEVKDINIVCIPRAGTITAWHRHFSQTDYWICVQGAIQAGLVSTDDTKNWLQDGYVKEHSWVILSPRNHTVLQIKPRVWHGYKSLMDNTILVYGITQPYNPDDEHRASIREIGVEWNLGAR